MSDHPDMSAGPVFDSLDIDLLVKVLKHTAFSTYPMSKDTLSSHVHAGPFFVSLIPTLFVFQGNEINSVVVIGPVVWLVVIATFCAPLSIYDAPIHLTT